MSCADSRKTGSRPPFHQANNNAVSRAMIFITRHCTARTPTRLPASRCFLYPRVFPPPGALTLSNRLPPEYSFSLSRLKSCLLQFQGMFALKQRSGEIIPKPVVFYSLLSALVFPLPATCSLCCSRLLREERARASLLAVQTLQASPFALFLCSL